MLDREYKVKGDELIFRVCPFCGNDRWNFQVNVELGVYHCWVCSAGGSISKIRHMLPLQVKVDEVSSNYEEIEDLHRYSPVWVYPSVMKYLENRGFTQEDANLWNVRTDGQVLFFPLLVKDDKVKYWVKKDLSTGKYYCPKGISKRKVLVFKEGDKYQDICVIVEGLFDGMKVRKAGFSVFVLLGKLLFKEWIQFLNELEKDKVVMLDGDVSEQDLDNVCRNIRDVWVVLLDKDKDPADCSVEEIRQLVLNAEPYGVSVRLRKRWQR